MEGAMTVSCPMEFSQFPFDIQNCPFDIGSTSFSENKMWFKSKVLYHPEGQRALQYKVSN